MLLKHGAGETIKNNNGETQLYIAENLDISEYPNKENIIQILKQAQQKDNKRKHDQSSSNPNKRHKPDQNNSSQFVEKTLNRQDYQVWLTQEDIADVARIKYGWHGEDDNVIFEIIGSVEQLDAQLSRYKIKVPGKQSLTFIINLNGNHWVTLVITHHNQQFSAYYINSFGDKITSDIHDKLNLAMPRIEISNPKFKQQEGDYNCGIFALENAKIINDVIQSGQINQIEQSLECYKPTSYDLKNKRKEFAEALQQQKSIRVDFEENKPEDSNQEKPRIFSSDCQPMEVDLVEQTNKKPATDNQLQNSDVSKPKQARSSWVSNPQHIAGDLKKSLHGNDYQLKLLMLFAWESRNSEVVFRLATEMAEAEKFDDLVFRYINGEGHIEYLFLQAKHRQFLGEENKIKVSDLKSNSDDNDFSLQKYFVSYLKDTQKQEFQDGLPKDFIICTNTDFDFEPSTTKKEHKSTKDRKKTWKGYFSEKTDEDKILNLGGKRFQFSGDPIIRKEIIFELEPIFTKSLEKNNLSSDNINKIGEFLDKLVFAVEQPSGSSLEQKIKDKIGDEFNLMEDITYNNFYKFMSDWMQHRVKDKGEKGEGRSCFLTHDDVEQFFNEARYQLAKLILIGSALEYRAKIKEFDINFGQDAFNKLGLGDFLTYQSNKQIFNVIAEQNELSSIKVHQILESISGYQKDDSYIFIRLSSLLRIQDRVVQAFNSENNNLLVIECKSAKNDVENLYEDLKDIIKNKSIKKIVLITRQGDALANKFKNGFSDRYDEENDKKNSLIDLTDDSQQKLLENGKVIFQGEEVNLGTLIDRKSKHLIDAEVLSKLINNEKIEIDKAPTDSKYDAVKDYYIPRTFNRYYVKIKEKFKKEKLFLVTHDSQVTNSNLQQGQNIVLISDIDKDFKKLCEKYKEHNIHWLKEERSEFIWQQSHGSLSKLREFVYTNEYELKEITDITDRVVIIAAKPGMGKSTVLTHLAVKTKESDPSLWIVRINLLDHSNELSKWKKDKIKIDKAEAVKFLYRAINFQLFKKNREQAKEKKQMINNILKLVAIKNNGEIALKNSGKKKIKRLNLLEVKLFNYFYNQGKIALLFDGFDEISPNYKSQVIELLEVLKGTKAEKIWMTSRPYNIQSELENKLSTFSYALKPFLEKEQRSFLKKFWKKDLKLDELDNNRFSIFANELLERFSQSINDQERKFTSIPLQISMIAKIFQDTFKEFYYSKKNELSYEQERKLSEKLDLVTLYEYFFTVKFCEIRFGEKKPGMNTADPDMQEMIKKEYKEFIESHKKLALYTLFEEYELGKLLSEQEMTEVHSLIENIKQGKEKTGIIDRIINGKPNFIHRTFAEYFTANYLWEKFKSIQFDKFEEDFIKSIIIKNVIKDDRIQICKFFQLETQKDFENNIDFSDKEGKLKTLLIKLVDKTYRYGPYKDKNSKQSTKLLWKIIEFSLSAKEESDLEIIRNVQNLESYEKLALLSVSAEMGYIKLANALGKKLNTKFLQDYIRNDKWFYNPLWLAAENGHLDIVRIFVEKLSYDTTWKDKDGMILLQRIFQMGAFNVLRSCLNLDIIDGKLCKNFNHREELPLVAALNAYAPSDVIKLLIEKTDVDLINKFKDPIGFKVVYYMILNLLKYGKEITELAIKKGIDFSKDINVLLFEFNYESLNSPIDQLNNSSYCKLSFHSDEEFLNLFDIIELILKGGAGYNCKDEHKTTTLQYAERTHYIHKLLDGVYKLHNQKNDKGSSPLGTILKLIIDSMSRSSDDFRGYEIIINSRHISLLQYDKEISLLPYDMAELLFESYRDSNTNLVKGTLDEVRSYISNAKEEIEQFKEYPDSKIYNDIFYGYEIMFDIWRVTNRKDSEQKKCQYESLNKFVKDLLGRVLKLYIRQDYDIDDALEEVSEEVSKFGKVINRLSEIKNLGRGKNVYDTDEILYILDIKSIDTNKELQDLISKIYECGGIQSLSQTWSNLVNIGQKRIMEILELTFKFSDQSSKIFELLKKLDSSYNELTDAIKNKNYQEINNILQNAEPDFIKAIINGQDDKYGSPLRYAVCKGDVETTRILLTHGANPNLGLDAITLSSPKWSRGGCSEVDM